MSEKTQKREKILDILAGQVESESPRIDRSELGRIAKQDAPKFSPGAFGLVAPPLILALSALALAYLAPAGLDPVLLQAVPFIVVGLSFVWFMLCHIKRASQVKAYAQGLEKALEELENLKNYVRRYMQNLDQRTSKYFAAVTNTKVTTYFILMQLGNAIEESILEVRPLLQAASPRSVTTAFNKLKGQIIFHDGAIKNQGETHVLPLARIAEVIPDLIENLEEGLRELESEISSTQPPFRSPPKE